MTSYPLLYFHETASAKISWTLVDIITSLHIRSKEPTMGGGISYHAPELLIPEEISKEEFRKLIGEEFFSEAVFLSLQKDNNITRSAFLSYLNNITDCFLTHDWGENGTNHRRVSVINQALKKKGMRTWFDEELMKDDTRKQMREGIDNCGCVVVFVTPTYMEKVAGKGPQKELDNCLFAFTHAANTKGSVKMVAVVTDSTCKDTSLWYGEVGNNMKGLLSVDYTQDDGVEKVAEDITKNIMDVIKTPITTRIQQYLEAKEKVLKEQSKSQVKTLLTNDDNKDDCKASSSLFRANNETIREAVKDYCENKITAISKYGPIDTWDTSQVTDMKELFAEREEFNENINTWDVSNVTNMVEMFCGATLFNSPINNWNVSKVTNMSGMFKYMSSFNSPLDKWDVSKVKNMSEMFWDVTSFNQSINSWDVSNVVNMSYMFRNAIAFNSPLNNWNVKNVKNVNSMFWGAIAFNQPLDNWNVSNVTDMNFMFKEAVKFNSPLNTWDVSNVTCMCNMFSHATSFNQPLNKWNIGQVTDMSDMFTGATAFNQSYKPKRTFMQSVRKLLG